MTGTKYPVSYRRYQAPDYEAVASLWARINRELAPAGKERLFEKYIARIVEDELSQLEDVFSARKRNVFWVVESACKIVGCFGIQSSNDSDTELRRMYLDKDYRGQGIAQHMLDHAKGEARKLGFNRMILSTAEIQKAAVKFYQKNEFRLVRTEAAGEMTAKQAGGGLTRCHFEQIL
jgi:GNAT superfamily N-acetyltransferase